MALRWAALARSIRLRKCSTRPFASGPFFTPGGGSSAFMYTPLRRRSEITKLTRSPCRCVSQLLADHAVRKVAHELHDEPPCRRGVEGEDRVGERLGEQLRTHGSGKNEKRRTVRLFSDKRWSFGSGVT